MTDKKKIQSIQWTGGSLVLLDQRRLPHSSDFVICKTLDSVIEAIQKMIVRGAPAIALSGMYGICLYLQGLQEKPSLEALGTCLKSLLHSRPTAVNLKLAIERYHREVLDSAFETYSHDSLTGTTIQFANQLFLEDADLTKSIAEYGTKIFENSPKNLSILTHCNTGSLATAGTGTAIGVIKALKDKGYQLTVYASETRPYHQGSRLTAWEMMQEGIESYILSDSMSAWLLSEKKIDAVIVGADRIASNGDTANKIGTYSHAIIAKYFGIPFYIAASETSFDFSIDDGKKIHIEMRAEEELTQNSFLKDENGKNYIPEGVLAPVGARAVNPAFDVTPAELITGIITEKGIISPVNKENIQKLIPFINPQSYKEKK